MTELLPVVSAGRDWLLVNEEFVAPQGEGATMGRTAYWIRLGACNLKCKWCDTAQTWCYDDRHVEAHEAHVRYDPRTELHRAKIFLLTSKLLLQPLRRVVFTGGEPLLQLETISKLISSLNEEAFPPFSFEFETAGTIPPGELRIYHNVTFNVSPKLASSGNPIEKRRNSEAIKQFVSCAGIFKFVVDTRDKRTSEMDLEEIYELIDEWQLPPGRIWLSPCGTTESEVIFGMRNLEPIVIRNGWNLSSRLHILMHGNERGH